MKSKRGIQEKTLLFFTDKNRVIYMSVHCKIRKWTSKHIDTRCKLQAHQAREEHRICLWIKGKHRKEAKESEGDDRKENYNEKEVAYERTWDTCTIWPIWLLPIATLTHLCIAEISTGWAI